MKLSPLKAYRSPDYPTQEILHTHPELLRVVPSRWKHNRVVLGSLAGMLALMEQAATAVEDQPASRAAPIFEHGKGKGSYGCVVVNPPVFLTEAEAREIIEDEAKKAGLEFTDRNRQIDKVPVPYVEKYVVWEDPKPDTPPTSGKNADVTVWFHGGGNLAARFQKKGPEQTREVTREEEVRLTGWNPQKQVGYRFVSNKDFEARLSENPVNYEKLPDGQLKLLAANFSRSTVSGYDVRNAAGRLTKGLQGAKEPGTVGVFYDPMTDIPSKLGDLLAKGVKTQQELEAAYDASLKESNEARQERLALAKKASAEELRAQVRDFLAWLKAQGVM